jgi:hypothetical protein
VRRSVEQLADPRTAPEAMRGAAMALGALPGIRLQPSVQDVLAALAAAAILQVRPPLPCTPAKIGRQGGHACLPFSYASWDEELTAFIRLYDFSAPSHEESFWAVIGHVSANGCESCRRMCPLMMRRQALRDVWPL